MASAVAMPFLYCLFACTDAGAGSDGGIVAGSPDVGATVTNEPLLGICGMTGTSINAGVHRGSGDTVVRGHCVRVTVPGIITGVAGAGTGSAADDAGSADLLALMR